MPARFRLDGPRLLGIAEVLIILILLLAFGLRVYGMTFGAPFEGFYWWDERLAIARSLKVATNFGPSSVSLGLYPLVLSAIYYPLSIAQNQSWNPRAISMLSLSDRLLIGRTLVVLAGTLLVGVVYVLGRRVAGRWGALGAALFTAVSPTLVAESRYATTGVLVTLFTYVTLLPLTDRRLSLRKRMALGALVALLAALTKNNGIAAFALLPLALAAEMLASRKWRRRLELGPLRIVVLAGLCLAGLLAAAWLAGSTGLLEFVEGATSYARIYRAGASPLKAFQWMLRYEWPLLLGGAVGAASGILRRDRLAETLLLASFVILYAFAVSLFNTLFVRWLMVILPGLAVLTGIALARAAEFERTRYRTLANVLFLVMVAFSTVHAWKLGYNLLHDARIAAWEWAQEQMPAGARIAAEPHALPDGDLVRTRYRIQSVKRAISEPPSFYVENGFQYVLTSDDIYDRWQGNPEAHLEEMARYQDLAEEFEQVAEFHGTLLYAPPAIDIHVFRVSEVPLYPEGRLTLGAGWYGAEQDARSGVEFRWMTEKGQLFYRWSGAGSARRLLSFDAYVFRDKGEVSVYVNDTYTDRLSLPAGGQHHVELQVQLSPGLNTIELVSEHGCARPMVSDAESSDQRCISIKVGNPQLDGR